MKEKKQHSQKTKDKQSIEYINKPLTESETLDLLIYGEDVLDTTLSHKKTR